MWVWFARAGTRRAAQAAERAVAGRRDVDDPRRRVDDRGQLPAAARELRRHHPRRRRGPVLRPTRAHGRAGAAARGRGDRDRRSRSTATTRRRRWRPGRPLMGVERATRSSPSTRRAGSSRPACGSTAGRSTVERTGPAATFRFTHAVTPVDATTHPPRLAGQPELRPRRRDVSAESAPLFTDYYERVREHPRDDAAGPLPRRAPCRRQRRRRRGRLAGPQDRRPDGGRRAISLAGTNEMTRREGVLLPADGRRGDPRSSRTRRGSTPVTC